MIRFPHALALAALLALAPALAPAQDGTRTISVMGTGEVAVTPDMATVTAGVRARAASADAALSANAAQMTRVFEALEAIGVAKRDMQTASLSLHPVYRQVRTDDGVEQRSDGFEVANMLRIRLRDMDKVGPSLDALVDAGVNELHGVAFDVADKAALLDQARAAAVRDARRKATLYADAANATLGPVVSIAEQGADRPVFPRPEMAMSRDAATPIAEGEQIISVSLSVVYGIAE